MAVHPPYSNVNPPIASTDSDYGSDIEIDDATADELLSQTESQGPLRGKEREKQAVFPSIEQSIEQPFIAQLEEDVFTHNFSVRLARSLQRLDGAEEIRARVGQIVQGRRREAAVEVEYDERNRREFSPSNAEEPTQQATATPEPTKKKDTRTPLQRFKARSPLSVTNLVSPSWCEQQYEYNLSHYGRIPKTKAMSAGSSVHKELEEQVQVEVPVEVVTREDRFGLKLWNTIQGLRALRETGLTRELEVWGVLEGEVVNGIIDEVTVECPDVEMEGRVLRQMEGGGNGGKKKEPELAPDQRTLTEFLTGSTQGGSILEHQANSYPVSIGIPPDLLRDRPNATYYLKDVKTTARSSPPAQGAYTRGSHIQLMLYHRMLSSLAADAVPGQQVFERYRLDKDANFSDKFIAELANLDMRAFVSVPDDAELPPSSQEWQRDPLGELLERNSLAKLWGLLVEECQRTFPSASTAGTTTTATGTSATTHASISPLLTVEYRTSKRGQGVGDAPIGTRSFPLDPKHLDGYIKSEISWWRGERATVGVSVEDAWKCGRLSLRVCVSGGERGLRRGWRGCG